MRRLAILFLALAAVSAQASEKTTFFGAGMRVSSLQTTTLGENPDEARRLESVEATATERFRAEGYELVDLVPVAEDVERVANPVKCYGCDIRMAQKPGADCSLAGEVRRC